MSPFLVLRIVATTIGTLIALGVIATFTFVAMRLWSRWQARRLGATLLPIGVRLLPHTDSIGARAETRAAEVEAAGFRPLGRFVTDRAPRAVVVAFAHPEGRAYAAVVEHPTLGTYAEVTRGDGRASVSAITARLPLGAKPVPDLVILSRPRASIPELLALVEREGQGLAPFAHRPADFIREWEASYRRGMTWAYTEGALRNVDPEAQARFTGIPVDPETAYFLKVRRESQARPDGKRGRKETRTR